MNRVDGAALAFGGTAPRLIKQRENAVYEISLPTGRAALRLHRPGYQSPDAIRSELWWCDALAGQGVPVPRPLRTLAGEVLVPLDTGQFASAVTWIDGAPLGEAGVPLAGRPADCIKLHHSLGRLIAQVHAATENLAFPGWFTRPNWNLDGLTGDTPFWGKFWDHPALTPQEAALARSARNFLRDRIGDHASRQPPRLIHADVLRENVFVNDDSLSLIDFDDSGFGFPLYDLGTALSQNLTEPALPEIAAALIEGYGETRPIDATMVPVFTLMRCCASVGWMIPRLEPGNPIIRAYVDRMTGLARTMLDGRSPW